MDLIIIIIILLLVVLTLMFLFSGGGRNGFISMKTQELYNNAKKAFAVDSSYSNFKKYVKNTDPVEFMELHNLYRQGRL
jgi:flagellar basal body-associated protein FliL